MFASRYSYLAETQYRTIRRFGLALLVVQIETPDTVS
jgi:hypothetical protein